MCVCVESRGGGRFGKEPKFDSDGWTEQGDMAVPRVTRTGLLLLLLLLLPAFPTPPPASLVLAPAVITTMERARVETVEILPGHAGGLRR